MEASASNPPKCAITETPKTGLSEIEAQTPGSAAASPAPATMTSPFQLFSFSCNSSRLRWAEITANSTSPAFSVPQSAGRKCLHPNCFRKRQKFSCASLFLHNIFFNCCGILQSFGAPRFREICDIGGGGRVFPVKTGHAQAVFGGRFFKSSSSR